MMDYAEFMADTYRRLRGVTFNPDACPDCGGTGIHALRCCSGHDCGCQGMPIDYVPCQRCGRRPPAWFVRVEW